ncbi:hypothetical protein BH18ACT1_BH18ACT1_16060 [soil metagenome]
MRFSVESTLPGSVPEVLAILLDPGFLAELCDLPKVSAPEVLEHRADERSAFQRVRYRFTGSLSSAVTRVLDPGRLTWVDETTWDLEAGTGTFRILPDHYANRLRCSGTYRLDPIESGCRRRAAGDLVVSYPIVGRAVERAIVGGLEEHLEAEVELITRRLGA